MKKGKGWLARVEGFLNRHGFEWKGIAGCEAYEPGGSTKLYLRRWTLCKPARGPVGAVYLHVFYRSDHGIDLHDHPWGFVSLILANGYREYTPVWADEPTGKQRWRRQWPGMILFRRATHRHRVELINGRPAVTLVIRGRRCRDWGFHIPKRGFVQWEQFFREKGC